MEAVFVDYMDKNMTAYGRLEGEDEKAGDIESYGQ